MYYDKFTVKNESGETELEVEKNQENNNISVGLKNNALYVNGKASTVVVDSKNIYEIVDIYELTDIVVTAVKIDQFGNSAVVIINKDANIIYKFVSKGVAESINSQNTIYLMGSQYLSYSSNLNVKNNSIYITSDNLGRDAGVACSSKSNDVLAYNEEFKYLGNNNFSESKLIKQVTAKEYLDSNPEIASTCKN